VTPAGTPIPVTKPRLGQRNHSQCVWGLESYNLILEWMLIYTTVGVTPHHQQQRQPILACQLMSEPIRIFSYFNMILDRISIQVTIF